MGEVHKCIYWSDAKRRAPGVNAILCHLVELVFGLERDDPVQDCKPGDIRCVAKPESLHQLASVLLDRLDGDAKLVSGLLVKVAERDIPGDLTHADRHWWFFQCHLFIWLCGDRAASARPPLLFGLLCWRN